MAIGTEPVCRMTTARLNILHVGKFYRPHRGGIESHLEVLCSALRHRVDLEVVVANDGRGTVREIVDGVSVTRLGSILSFGSTSICPRLPTLLRDSRADIIHIHVPHPVAIAAYLMSSNSCRLVVTYHSDIVRQRLIGAALEPLLHRALARSSAVIATSQRYLDSSPVLGLYRDRCHVVPNAVQIERFDAPLANEVSGIKQRFGSRIVLTVGRLVYYKGLEYLIDAMVGIDAKLLIIGDGPFRTKLQRQIARLGLQERVIMMGEVDDVVPY